MRYHWGLGVGHYHTHQGAAIPPENSQDEPRSSNLQDDVMDSGESPDEDNSQSANAASLSSHPGANDGEHGSDVSDSDDGELGLDDRQQDGWEDVESELDSESEERLGDDAEPEDEVEDYAGI